MKIIYQHLALTLLVSGCATQVRINSTFDEKEVSWATAKGTNSIKGQAFLRTRGGDIKTCAGFDVVLHPRSAYGAERIRAIYGNDYAGILKNTNVPPPDPKYFSMKRVTKCETSGDFEFNNLPDGTYYLITAVTWESPSGYYPYSLMKQGGGVMLQVSVKNGESKKVQMTGEQFKFH